MPPMLAARIAAALVCLLAAGALLAGCGGGEESSESTGDGVVVAESRPAPPKADFPIAAGRSLEEVLRLADGPSELAIEPAAMVFYEGENRYPFGVSERYGAQIPDAEVALYVARALDRPAIGPLPARIESLAAGPAFRAKATEEGPEAAVVVYSAQADFPSDGEWQVAALVKDGDEIQGKLLPAAMVGEFESIPRSGEKAPSIHTPTAEDVGHDLSKITTRIPPDTQNKVDYADALGKEPIVLLFATPQFCQSRVCGPVVDVTEQAKQEYGDEAAFIHMEIYNDNDPGKGVRPQARAFHLPSEPWLFTIDRNGVVSEAIEGAFGAELLDKAIETAVR
jgi:hypothetical protein